MPQNLSEANLTPAQAKKVLTIAFDIVKAKYYGSSRGFGIIGIGADANIHWEEHISLMCEQLDTRVPDSIEVTVCGDVYIVPIKKLDTGGPILMHSSDAEHQSSPVLRNRG